MKRRSERDSDTAWNPPVCLRASPHCGGCLSLDVHVSTWLSSTATPVAVKLCSAQHRTAVVWARCWSKRLTRSCFKTSYGKNTTFTQMSNRMMKMKWSHVTSKRSTSNHSVSCWLVANIYQLCINSFGWRWPCAALSHWERRGCKLSAVW